MTNHWLIEEASMGDSVDVIRQDAKGKHLVVRIFSGAGTADERALLANEVALHLAEMRGGTAHTLPI